MKNEHDITLELSAIHSMLADQSCFMSAAAVNPPADIFSSPENSIVYSEAMKYFLNTGHVPGLDTIYESLILSGKYPAIKEHFINRIYNADFLKHTDSVIKELTERKIEREIAGYCKHTLLTGLDLAMGLLDFINKTLQKYVGGCVKEPKNVETAELVLKNIRDAMEGKFTGYIRTLIPDLDTQIIGIPNGNVTVIAARPGMGKTDLMLQLMRNFMSQDLHPCVFSLEMDARGLMIRNISQTADINSMKLENGDLNDEEFKILTGAAKKYSLDDYLIDDTAVETAEMIKAKINYWRLRHNTKVIMIDYMTLIKTNYRQERYDLEIGSLVRDLRAFAKETGIPIIILSQLNRDSEKRLSHRPQISDLRESGSIEQEASLVLLLYRPAEYGIDPFEGRKYTYCDSKGNPLKEDEYMEIIAAKARNGRTGTVPVKYIPSVHCIEGVICRSEKP